MKYNRYISRNRAVLLVLVVALILIASGLLLSCHQRAGDANPAGPAGSDTTAEAAGRRTPTASRKTILFFGNSLTAGYGLPSTNDAFPSLLQGKIDSLHLAYTVVNAGNSGETSAGGLGRIGWVLRQRVDIFVLELGANDGLRGLPVAQTLVNLQAIIDTVTARYPACKILLLGMQVPPNLGQKYTSDFKAVYPALAQKNNTALVPFLLQGVGGVASLNQGDGIHPNLVGEKIVADNVWAVLQKML
jgi:acyl-CoA thioesterase-1